jgi:glutamate formiminotransferase / 5-formyltetrahydrofolate cyclo-ligase
VLECVVNVSEGRSTATLDVIAAAAGEHLLDLHRDADHNRSVLTMAGPGVEEAVRSVAEATVGCLDLRTHTGAHPRIGVLDVVPFVPLIGSTLLDAVAARDRFACWAAAALELPCFLYGPERTLPEVRAGAFGSLPPDGGPSHPHRSAGATAVGARPVLVAYNLWLANADPDEARALARGLRSGSVRALGLQVGDGVQVSMNLLAPDDVGPCAVYDAVASRAAIARAEVVGLVPATVVASVSPARWAQLDLAADRTIEARLAAKGWG